MAFENPRKYSINLWGHQTSITLEPEFWLTLTNIAKQKKLSVKRIVESIDEERLKGKTTVNLSSCLRVWILRRVCELEAQTALVNKK